MAQACRALHTNVATLVREVGQMPAKQTISVHAARSTPELGEFVTETRAAHIKLQNDWMSERSTCTAVLQNTESSKRCHWGLIS